MVSRDSAMTLFLLVPLWRLSGAPAGVGEPADGCLASAHLFHRHCHPGQPPASTAALVLALAVARGGRGLELAAMLPLTASSLVLGTGIFLISRPFASPEDLALPVTLLVNAALTLPFVFRLILPEARNLHRDYGRLAMALDLKGWARLRLLDLPRLARPLGFGAGGGALSGDAG